MSAKILIHVVFTIACVALGIFLSMQYRPSPEYWMDWSLSDHLPIVCTVFLTFALGGFLLSKDIFRSFMIGLGGMFLATGFTFWMNAAWDSKPYQLLHYQVVQKGKAYEGTHKQAHWNYFLLGQTPEGRSFRFSTYPSHISMATWEAADPSLHSEILVEEHPGFLGIPWWIIR